MAFWDFIPNLFNSNISGYSGLSYKSRYICNTNILQYNPYEWYLKNPIVNYAVNERAKAISNFKFYIEEKDGTRNYEHPVIKKLNNPNPLHSGNELIESVIINLSIFGVGNIYINKFAYLERADILSLRSDRVKYKVDKNIDYTLELLKGNQDNSQPYYVFNSNGFKLKNDLLLPIYDSGLIENPYEVISKLISLRYIVSNIQTLLESKNTVLSNPGGIGYLTKSKETDLISTPLENSQDELKQQHDYGTRTNQKAIRKIDEPLKFERTSPKIDEFKFNDNFKNDALVIFGAFGLPKELFTALIEGSTFENQNEAFKRFLQVEGQNKIDKICKPLSEVYGIEIKASCDHLPVFQENEKERAECDKIKSETLKMDKEVYDDWLIRGFINEKTYKEKFML